MKIIGIKMIAVLCILLSISCCTKNRQHKDLSDLIGKSVVFPQNLPCYRLGIETCSSECTEMLNAKNKILIYVDSTINNNELLSGLLSILNSSNNYWYNLETDPLDPIPYDPLVVQVDCIGYIFGWCRSYSNDCDRYTNQKDFDAHSKGRIMDGLWGALTTSGVRSLLKLYTNETKDWNDWEEWNY